MARKKVILAFCLLACLFQASQAAITGYSAGSSGYLKSGMFPNQTFARISELAALETLNVVQDLNCDGQLWTKDAYMLYLENEIIILLSRVPNITLATMKQAFKQGWQLAAPTLAGRKCVRADNFWNIQSNFWNYRNQHDYPNAQKLPALVARTGEIDRTLHSAPAKDAPIPVNAHKVKVHSEEESAKHIDAFLGRATRASADVHVSAILEAKLDEEIADHRITTADLDKYWSANDSTYNTNLCKKLYGNFTLAKMRKTKLYTGQQMGPYAHPSNLYCNGPAEAGCSVQSLYRVKHNLVGVNCKAYKLCWSYLGCEVREANPLAPSCSEQELSECICDEISANYVSNDIAASICVVGGDNRPFSSFQQCLNAMSVYYLHDTMRFRSYTTYTRTQRAFQLWDMRVEPYCST